MPNENQSRAQLKLEAVVEYEPNGVKLGELMRWLGILPFAAYHEGTLTRDTPATCAVISSEVNEVNPENVVRDMEPADYLRKAIWAMDDLVRLYPEGNAFQAVRDGLSARLSDEMSKGPKEVKDESPNQDAANAP